MPINPITGTPLPYAQGGGTSMVGSQQPQTAPGRVPMWTGGGANPGFAPQAAPQPPGLGGALPPGLGRPMPVGTQGPPPGMPLGLTPQILAKVQARMAANQFRSGPEDSLLPTGVGNSPFARMMPGDY